MDTFKCKRCGKCCGLVPFTRKEYKKIQRKAKKLRISFVKKDYGYITKKAQKKLSDLDKNKNKIEGNLEQDLTCPFLSFNKEGLACCEIYEDRPKICRDFGKGTHPYLVCSNNLHIKGIKPIILEPKTETKKRIEEFRKILKN